jgi:hypothetical protein
VALGSFGPQYAGELTLERGDALSSEATSHSLIERWGIIMVWMMMKSGSSFDRHSNADFRFLLLASEVSY